VHSGVVCISGWDTQKLENAIPDDLKSFYLYFSVFYWYIFIAVFSLQSNIFRNEQHWQDSSYYNRIQ